MKLQPGIYVHYKSDDMRYEVLGVGRNTETGEEYAIYRPLYVVDKKPDFWVRPIDMFLGVVDVNGEKIPRFRKIESGK